MSYEPSDEKGAIAWDSEGRNSQHEVPETGPGWRDAAGIRARTEWGSERDGEHGGGQTAGTALAQVLFQPQRMRKRI